MLTKRIIPCLDIKDGRTVKGTRFDQLIDAGDPVELAAEYCRQGADELVFLDISATHEQRQTLIALVTQIARCINIPFTVGGGIRSEDDVSALLNAGADKISLNSAAVRDPSLISRLAARFGSQCVVVAIDSKAEPQGNFVYINGGRIRTEYCTEDWARQAVLSGAGEILLTSMDHDGTKAGFALELTRRVSESVTVPVIASGGAGTVEHFKAVFSDGAADAALAAGIFHRRELEIPSLKSYLRRENIPVRLTSLTK